MAGPWPPATRFFGLHVDLGDYHTKRAEWLQLPTAAFTCRWGCELVAVGAADVAHLTQSITATHARTCPGPSSKE
ncbi:hypothetical protein QA802_30795 [Streptomyces sp. B21-105]|uniref:hypothetical protein n=1 Tax=Streptomyces sp. B21-105 TaxID=3039417 RepID=UPI002FF1233C